MAIQKQRKPTGLFSVILLLWLSSCQCITQEPSSSCCGACFQGQAGTPGVPGIPGNLGGIGVQGPIGPKGDPGSSLPGPKGETGDQGRKGDAGMRGVSGKLGPSGRKGDIGEGHKGDQGEPGGQGPPGEMGHNGQPGEATLVAPTPPSAVAFSAYRTTNVIGNYGGAIIFDNVETNLGGGYDSQSGVFTCSIPGAYFFTTTILSLNTARRPWLHLIRNDIIIFTIYDSGGAQHQSSNSAVLVLTVGDRVWMKFIDHTAGFYSSSYKYSYFSGFLLYAM